MHNSIKYAFIFIFFSHLISFSQKEKISRLHKLYEKEKNRDLIKANGYAKRAIELGEKEKNDSINSISYYYFSEVLYKQRLILEAERSVKKAIKLAESSKNLKTLCLSYLNLGNVNYHLGKYSENLHNIELALSIQKELKDDSILHKILNRKAVLLKKTNNKEKAIKVLKENLKEGDFINENNIAYTYNSLGANYLTTHKDSSIYFYKKALSTLKDSENLYLKSILHQNLGDVFLQIDNNSEALKHLFKAEENAIKVSDNVGLYYINTSLAVFHHNIKDYKIAIEKYTNALDLYGKYVEKDQIAHSYWLLSEALYFDNQFKEGFLIQEKYMELKDSLFTVEKSKTFERLQTEYDVEKKNNQIAYLEEKQALEAKQRKLIIGLGGLVLFVLLLLVFLYRYRAKSQKVIRTQEKQLFLQEKEQLKQNEKLKRVEGYVEGEEKEKNRIALELHDGIGGQLSGILHLATSLPENENSLALTNNLKTISKEVRLLSHSLSTSFSELQPFQNLLQTLKERYKNHFTIEIYLFPEEALKDISNKQKTFLYRSIQEVLNNIYKHAKAKLVQLSLTISDEIVLVIEDDGVGFNTDKVPNGIGLQNIKERISYLKGEFILDSKENEGTSVIIKIPKENEED